MIMYCTCTIIAPTATHISAVSRVNTIQSRFPRLCQRTRFVRYVCNLFGRIMELPDPSLAGCSGIIRLVDDTSPLIGYQVSGPAGGLVLERVLGGCPTLRAAIRLRVLVSGGWSRELAYRVGARNTVCHPFSHRRFTTRSVADAVSSVRFAPCVWASSTCRCARVELPRRCSASSATSLTPVTGVPRPRTRCPPQLNT